MWYNFCLLITVAKNQAARDVGCDLDPNCLTVMRLLKAFFFYLNTFLKESADAKTCKVILHANSTRETQSSPVLHFRRLTFPFKHAFLCTFSRKNRTIEIMHRMEVGSAILNILINLVASQSSFFPLFYSSSFICLVCGLTSHSKRDG